MKTAAKDYEPEQTQNIADLERVSVDVELEDDVFTCTDDKTGKEKTVQQMIFVQDGIKYRVPKTVFSQLQDHLKENKDLKFFKVSKKGSGFSTVYTVIPLADSGSVEETVE